MIGTLLIGIAIGMMVEFIVIVLVIAYFARDDKRYIIKSYQIPNRITMGIFNLPCVTEVIKSKYYGGFFYGIDGYLDINGDHKVMRKDGSVVYQAHKGDWLCYCNDGNWYILTDKEYKGL